jgi:hypothetical protein
MKTASRRRPPASEPVLLPDSPEVRAAYALADRHLKERRAAVLELAQRLGWPLVERTGPAGDAPWRYWIHAAGTSELGRVEVELRRLESRGDE